MPPRTTIDGAPGGTLSDTMSASARRAVLTASYELLALFTVLFGIPLSFISLLSGIVLGVGTKWGILRYAWVTTKLLSVWAQPRGPSRRATYAVRAA
jgi:hypothetical protein